MAPLAITDARYLFEEGFLYAGHLDSVLACASTGGSSIEISSKLSELPGVVIQARVLDSRTWSFIDFGRYLILSDGRPSIFHTFLPDHDTARPLLANIKPCLSDPDVHCLYTSCIIPKFSLPVDSSTTSPAAGRNAAANEHTTRLNHVFNGLRSERQGQGEGTAREEETRQSAYFLRGMQTTEIALRSQCSMRKMRIPRVWFDLSGRLSHSRQGRPSHPGQHGAASRTDRAPITHAPEPIEARLEEDHGIIDAFGTMAINRRGCSAFLGRTARPEFLLNATPKSQRVAFPTAPRISKRIMELSFPESQIPDASLVTEMLELLPSQSDGLHLCDVYLEHGKFVYTALPRKELLDDIFAVYRTKHLPNFEHFHALSLLFIVFALATLFDPSSPPYAPEGHEYFYLSRAAFNHIGKRH
ncbi:unnamed protein product [Cyclocybe aegerita]|uniref:Uncharacterized protein n=1 Tax=Cyclocybe aegerita TaxID=1973307 RepID=A0A8S0XQ91_CYCAE|nr:unnamed protein product [Cyclocybe aegerita]